MASLQKKNDSWHIQFLYRKQRRTWVIGPVEETEAWVRAMIAIPPGEGEEPDLVAPRRIRADRRANRHGPDASARGS